MGADVLVAGETHADPVSAVAGQISAPGKLWVNDGDGLRGCWAQEQKFPEGAER